MKIIDVAAEIESNPAGTFLRLAEHNGYHFGAVSIAGENSTWEMHPDTDEFFHILEGEAEITLLEDSGEHRYVATAGTVFVVPKGIWHKPSAPKGVRMMYYTPGWSLHSDAADPRQ